MAKHMNDRHLKASHLNASHLNASHLNASQLNASAPQGSILVVDDEPSIVDAVGTALRYEGFDVRVASTGRAALAAAQEEPPDLIVLDVMLPDLDGLEVTRRLRTDGLSVPVLFLTAKDDVDDKVAALTVGGDDYVTKPFSLAELVARTKAVLRRTGHDGQGDGRLRFSDVEMDEDTHEAWRSGMPLRLTATEFRLLRFFLLNPRRVLSKAQIVDHVWHYDFDGDHNVVETYVSYLRKKLEKLGPPLIHTIRLVGYTLREAD
jgi:two-component system OmpR family response regulator